MKHWIKYSLSLSCVVHDIAEKCCYPLLPANTIEKEILKVTDFVSSFILISLLNMGFF